MKKLRLSVEALAVDSFATLNRDGGREGTVYAHFATRGSPNTCNVGCCNTCVDCPPAPTVAATCAC
jgi:predicted metal-binding protein